MIILKMITICELFIQLILTWSSMHYECVYVSFSKLLSKQKRQEHKVFGFLLGPKPLPLGEENPCKILLMEIPFTNTKTMTLDTFCLSKTKTSIPYSTTDEIIIFVVPLHHWYLHYCFFINICTKITPLYFY